MIDTNHEGYSGRASALQIPQSATEAMAALGNLLAGTMPDPDDEDGCENAAAWLDEPTCTIKERHCEVCGATDCERPNDGYSTCCNERIVSQDTCDHPGNHNRVETLVEQLEASIAAARAKRDQAKT